MPSPSWMCLGSWVVRLRSIFWSKRKQEEEKKKKKKRKRKEKKETFHGDGGAETRRHGRSTVFGRMLRHYPFHVANASTTNARGTRLYRKATRTCISIQTRVAYKRRSHARGQQSAPVRPESKLRRSPASLRGSISHERAVSACMNARTRKQEHARKVEAKAQQSVDALMWPPPPLPSPPWIPLYLALLALSLSFALSCRIISSLFRFLCYFVAAPRSRLRSAIHLGVLADWTSPPVETTECDDALACLVTRSIPPFRFFHRRGNPDSWISRKKKSAMQER